MGFTVQGLGPGVQSSISADHMLLKLKGCGLGEEKPSYLQVASYRLLHLHSTSYEHLPACLPTGLGTALLGRLSV